MSLLSTLQPRLLFAAIANMPASRPQWPKVIVFDPGNQQNLKTLESGTRKAAKTWYGIGKGLALNVGFTCVVDKMFQHPIDVNQLFLLSFMSTCGSAPKTVLGTWIEDQWSKVSWGIKCSLEGRKETQIRIFVRNLSRKAASNVIDGAYYIGTTKEFAGQVIKTFTEGSLISAVSGNYLQPLGLGEK